MIIPFIKCVWSTLGKYIRGWKISLLYLQSCISKSMSYSRIVKGDQLEKYVRG